MLRSLLVFIHLFFALWTPGACSTAGNEFRLTNLPFLNAYASSSGQVQLIRDISGFYLNADLQDHSHDSDTDFGPDTVAMILSLYTSQTLFADGCLDFSPYNCTEYSCTPYEDSHVKVDSPYFTGEAYHAKAQLYVDYLNWKLNSNASIASTCTTNSALSYGMARYGIIGMGLEKDSRKNFLNSPIFSISLSEDLYTGQLLFRSGLSNSTTTTVATFDANENWHINASDCSIKVGHGSSFNYSTKIIFDINADAIGFPLDIYEVVMQELSNIASMNCSNHAYQPVCLYKGAISDLPNITIFAQNQNISISPTTYVQEASTPINNTHPNFITLNLKAISSNLADDSYVTPTYDGYIILDSHVISQYGISFDATSLPVITLFIENPSSDLGMMIEILMGAVVFLSVMFCCCFCSLKKKESPEVYTDLRTAELMSPEKSLYFNDQEMKVQQMADSQRTPMLKLQTLDQDGKEVEKDSESVKSPLMIRLNSQPPDYEEPAKGFS